MAVTGAEHDGCARIAGFKQTPECGASESDGDGYSPASFPGWEMGNLHSHTHAHTTHTLLLLL